MKSKQIRRGQRGVSLIEALVAFGVMAVGMLGVMGMQTTLRANSDVAKQRSEATRIAQEKIEQFRAFSVLSPLSEASAAAAPHVTAYQNIAEGTVEDVQGYTTNTSYRMVTEVENRDGLREVKVKVSWNDRHSEDAAGQERPHSVVLNTVIAGIDPALSGLLSFAPNGSPHKHARNRQSGIPIGATDLDDGRSVLRAPGSTVVWVFDNSTGLVQQVCTGFSGSTPSADLSGCTNVRGQVITGMVRFDTDGAVSASQAENPTSSPALPLTMSINIQGAGATSADCFDAVVGTHAVQYQCLVRLAATSSRWSGTLNVNLDTDTLGTTAADFRVCRYSADYNNRNSIENIEHPQTYTDVSGPLPNQNFLVIRGDNTCPSDVAANPAGGDLVNTNTVEHQPNPA